MEEDINGLVFYESYSHETKLKLKEKIHQLPLPKKLQKKLTKYLKPLTEELIGWLRQNHCRFKHVKIIPGKIFWTGRGTIDQVKSARAWMDDETLSDVEKYKSAAAYYLEDFAPFLWRKLQAQKVTEISKPFWLLRITDLRNDNSYVHVEFKISAKYGDLTGCKYFMKFLTQEEKDKLIPEAAKRALERCAQSGDEIAQVPYHELIRFLFLNMSQEQRINLCNRYKTEMWTCFLNWQWQNSPPDIFHLRLYFNQGSKDLLVTTVSKIEEDWDFNYPELCRIFWDESAYEHKKSMIEEFKKSNFSFWRNLLMAEDKTTLELFLKSASEEDKETIFLNNRRWFEYSIVGKDKWDLLKFLLGVLSVPKERLIAWKDYYARFSRDEVGREERVNIFVGILDEFIIGT